MTIARFDKWIHVSPDYFPMYQATNSWVVVVLVTTESDSPTQAANGYRKIVDRFHLHAN